MAFYLAIDNGGTKTDYALADELSELARVRSGTIKRMRTDAEAATANLETALRELEKQSGISMQRVARTCIGTAGESVPLVKDWLLEAIPARVSGEVLLLGDVEIALEAAFRGGPGVLVLAGTGSNVAGRTADGEWMRAGGWGPTLADQGSGHRIGQTALRSLVLAIDEGRSTTLAAEVLAFWKLKDMDELIAFANAFPAPDMSQLTRLVLRCANEGDEVAASVLERAGVDLAYLVRLVMRRMIAIPGATLPRLAFAGSVMEKVHPVRASLLAAVHEEFPKVESLKGTVDPLDGAVWRARTAGTP